MGNEILKLRDGRLHIFKQPGCQNYFYRFFVNGKYRARTTKTSNLSLAKSTAETAYDSYRFHTLNPNGKYSCSWDDAERGVLASLTLEQEARPSLLTTYQVKLGVLRKHFGSLSIQEINNRNAIDEYVVWRRTKYQTHVHGNVVTNKTLRRDFDVLRAILKYALEQGWVEKICEFPKLTVVPKSGGWFTPQEMVHLLTHSKQWIASASTDKERLSREYTHCYMRWLVFTGMRVDEALKVRFEDVIEVHKKDPNKKDSNTYLYVMVKWGKLAHRKGATEMIGLEGAVTAFERLKILKPNAQPKDYLFPVNPRERIRHLLESAGLLLDDRGQRRTAKCFRHTYIMSRLLHGVDVYTLSQNCRTSVQMIQQHYGSYLNARMKRKELTKLLSDTKKHGASK